MITTTMSTLVLMESFDPRPLAQDWGYSAFR